MKNKVFYLVFIILITLSDLGYSQGTYKVQEAKSVEMKISGTSTFHDWEMTGSLGTGEASFIFSADNENKLIDLKSLSFAVKVKDLKSDTKGLDKNAYQALKTDKFNSIYYSLKSANVVDYKTGYLIETKGRLTIAGESREIAMNIFCSVLSSESVLFKGSYNLKMTDYNVDPPSFMFGTMNTGNEIVLHFQVLYTKQKIN